MGIYIPKKKDYQPKPKNPLEKAVALWDEVKKQAEMARRNYCQTHQKSFLGWGYCRHCPSVDINDDGDDLKYSFGKSSKDDDTEWREFFLEKDFVDVPCATDTRDREAFAGANSKENER